MDNIQQKTAQTLLQQAEEVTIAGTKYQVPQPTLGTLILVSQSRKDRRRGLSESYPRQTCCPRLSPYDTWSITPKANLLAKV